MNPFSFSQSNGNPIVDDVLWGKLKQIGLYVGIALVVWYGLKRERL